MLFRDYCECPSLNLRSKILVDVYGCIREEFVAQHVDDLLFDIHEPRCISCIYNIDTSDVSKTKKNRSEPVSIKKREIK